ncbi:SDR family NAD(P)-dependent oxidoreductase [Streptomyces sp. KN37]|uniref:SDR family NAD(P)-dependent oxidoreductase n=1 Tax=Streptomyces sp. KN37 TaxID=3090667 RepID=UPI002A7472FC|nr:SDR family NAD(P)-dependent oxidoreductase [Streptomyces sp. KN37]WPO69277.1 SDR family NAD(P)-dependent oxidoreductase [Streptomyces sp. KN37]
MSSADFRDILDGYVKGAVGAEQARGLLEARRPAPEAATGHTESEDRTRMLDIAVVGMSGQFPGAADVREFWHNLSRGRVGYGELPDHYLAPDDPGGYRWGGALAERDLFDAEFFGIRPHEADLMSHNQRLLLQESWHALEDAALDPTSLAGSRTGLFIGAEPTGYPHESFTGASDALVASRLSYFLDLRGAALVVNTACSSSLAAVHLACQSLRSGESSLALVGGVNAGLDARGLDLLVESGAMSPSGRCRTFDADADGTVYSEAVAVLVLKRLSDAVADGDHIHGVVRATGMNQDGASNGITAPNGAAQEDLVLDVYRRFGIPAERVGYVEAHGTGTALGDPVEANALVRAFRRLTTEREFCAIGSAKAHIGHTGAPAGVVGLIKVLLSMRHGALVGMPTLRRLNPLIDLKDSAFVADEAPRPWRSGSGAPLMAAVNSFGHSGTNAHVVVEQYVPAAEPAHADDGTPQIVPLSARTPERLRAYASVLADHLENCASSSTAVAVAPPPEAARAAEPARVCAAVAGVLGVAADEIDPDEPLDSYGVRPEQFARIGEALDAEFGTRLGADVFHEGRTAGELARLAARAGDAGPTEGAEGAASTGTGTGSAVPSAADVARTLQLGRAELAARAALVVRDRAELLAGLRALAEGRELPDNCRLGEADGRGDVARLFADEELRDAVGKWLERGKLAQVAEVWVRGGSVEWRRLHRNGPVRRVPLPGYPFAKNHHGIPATATAAGSAPASVAAPVVPPVRVPGPVAEPRGELRPERLEQAMEDRIALMASELLGAAEGDGGGEVDPKEQLDRYGIDSITRTRLNQLLSEAFPSASRTLFFEFAKVEGVAGQLAEQFPDECRAFLGWDGTVVAPAPATQPAVEAAEAAEAAEVVQLAAEAAPVRGDDDELAGAIAVIGMSGTFPDAPDQDSYWQLLMEGRSAVTEIPRRRWDWREHYDPHPEGADVVRKSHSKWGAFLDGFDAFDPALFNFTEQEARNTDPQVRLFLQECWKALEDAGYAPAKLPAEVRGRIGVFAGGAKHGFTHLGSEGRLEMPRTSFGDMVNRVSFQFDLGGPSKAVDTACSSAHVALHEAVESLRSGRCDLAIAGAVNLYLHPSTYVELATVGLLSDRSDCASFGAEAAGIVPGEGVGAVLLKPLRQALRDGDPVRAVIRGSAVNHNGRTIGFTSPSSLRQAEVIREALRDARIDPRTVSYVEATANGSEIGDAVEMTALTQVFEDRTGVSGSFRIGSLKPNLGHGEASAGMAQLFKVVLALQHRTLPPTRLPEEFNPAIDIDRLPFELSAAPVPWHQVVVDGVPAPRRAGITGLGGGGTNAHVVLEEAPEPAPRARPAERGPVLFALSAHTEERLGAYVDAWLDFLVGRPTSDLADIAYTLQVGRVDLTHRLAVIASGAEELRGHLTRWRRGRPGDAVFSATAARVDTAGLDAALRGRDLGAVADLWVRGAAVDWAALYDQGDGVPVRVAGLPTYPFERRSCWLDDTDAGTGDTATPALQPQGPARDEAGHPLLTSAVRLADGGTVFSGDVSLATHPWITDHAVSGTVLFPGTGFVEMALHAGAALGCGRLEELTLEAPLTLTEQAGARLQLVVRAPDATGARPLEIHSLAESGAESAADGEGAWTRHATGLLAAGAAEAGFDLAVWPPTGAEPVPVDAYYQVMADAGYAYGPAFRGLRAVWRRGEEVYAEAALDDGPDAARYGLHPALLDSALHAMGFGGFVRDGGGLLPFSWSGMQLFGGGAAAVRVRLTGAGTDAVSAAVADTTGRPLAVLDSLVLRPFAGARRTPARTALPDELLRLEWTPLAPADTPRIKWTAAGPDELGLATALRRGDGADVPGASDGGGDEIALISLHAEPTDDLAAAVRSATARVHGLVRSRLADESQAAARLVVVTRRAVSTRVGEDVEDLTHAPVWGLLRAAQAENPDRLLLVDVDGAEASAAALPGAVAAATAAGESQLALRGGEATVPRLARLGSDSALVPPGDGTPWRLDTSGAGTLENLALLPWPAAEAPLTPGQVRIEVRAAGLNFRDVLGALGMYPGELTLGAEGAGVVVDVGDGVSGLAVGDRVMGLFPSGLGPVCVADAHTVVRMPRGWSFEQAAAVPVAFATAYYGLVDMGGLTAGESVLVHAAAGGVGMAAVQLARHLGAEVFATASEGKWDAVRGLGVPDDHLASSRDLGFEEKFRTVTDGRGVDVVLDSLAREFVDASLRLLPRGGRFVEMGKTDIRDAAQVATAHFAVRYRAFDIVDAGPRRIGEILAEIVDLFEQGVLTHLPRRAWDLRRAPEAFRFMSQARHVGKIVLTVPRRPDPEHTVLITGGTGTLGGMLARHLVAERGARHLTLLSRRGPDAPGAAGLAAELTAAGAQVTVVACDVADRARLAEVLDGIPAEHPLGTVVHTAGDLDDGVFDALTPERLARVLRPKAEGALNLHELTLAKGLDLAEFVLFSGAAGVLGNPGQSNYAAASSFLDALAQHRRARGLPGTSMAWGYWEQATGLTKHLSEEDTGRMARGGLLPIPSADGLALFDVARGADEPLQVPMRLDLDALRAQAEAGDGHPLHRGLLRGVPRTATATAATDGLPDLDGLPEAEQHAALLELVCAQVGSVLVTDPAAIGADTGFVELGLDSLTAVELRNRLGRATGLRLPVTLIFDHPAPGPLAAYLRRRLVRGDEGRGRGSGRGAGGGVGGAATAHGALTPSRAASAAQAAEAVQYGAASQVGAAGPGAASQSIAVTHSGTASLCGTAAEAGAAMQAGAAGLGVAEQSAAVKQSTASQPGPVARASTATQARTAEQSGTASQTDTATQSGAATTVDEPQPATAAAQAVPAGRAPAPETAPAGRIPASHTAPARRAPAPPADPPHRLLLADAGLDRLGAVLEFGCRDADALIGLAADHPALIVHGVSGDKEFADAAGRRIDGSGARGRVAVFHRSGPLDPFPGHYDLAYGIDGCYRVEDKQALFARLDAAVVDGGHVLLADYLCTLSGDLVDPGAGISVPTARTWSDVFARNRFVVEELLPHEPADPDPELAEAVRRGWIGHRLFRLRKQTSTTQEDRLRTNRAHLAETTAQPRAPRS